MSANPNRRFLSASVLASTTLLGAYCASAQGPTPGVVTPGAASNSTGDQDVKDRVTAALREEQFSDEQHVEVLVENGMVVLRGFVLSDWDRRHAVEAAKKAAGSRKVLDQIHMKEGQAH
jgi:osmotically-inducible protein OsmY